MPLTGEANEKIQDLGHMGKLFRLTGWTMYWDDHVMTFRHKCGWEIYSDELMPQGMLIEGIVEHVC